MNLDIKTISVQDYQRENGFQTPLICMGCETEILESENVFDIIKSKSNYKKERDEMYFVSHCSADCLQTLITEG